LESGKELLSLSNEEIKNSLTGNKLTICVIGIGRIGLPSALTLANSGFKTIGVDINSKLVEKINSGDYPLKDEPGFDKIFDSVIKNKKFNSTTDISATVPSSDIVLLSLPTPINKQNIPDYSALKSVAKDLSKLLKKGSIVIVESTVEPGFIENELIPIIENDSKKVGIDFGIAACPETANPGEILEDFKKVPRLVGGFDEKTTNIASELYKYVFEAEIIKMPDCKTANAAKLTANVFRDVNIAFVNELALLFEKLGIDIITVLEACGKKYNFEIHYPGAGVGGPCLPVNSYQLLSSETNVNGDMLKIVKDARLINEKMPSHVVELVADSFKELGKSLNGSIVVLLGVSYKPNIRDIQLSPAEKIIEQLEQHGAKIKIFDPYFISTEVFSHKTESDLFSAIDQSDAAIIVTAHKEFFDLDLSLFKSKMNTPILVDARGVIDLHAAKKAELIFRGIGRGKN